MQRFTFDARAALERAIGRPDDPNPPNPPNREGDGGSGLGRLGRLGTPRPSFSENPGAVSDEDTALVIDLFEERAAIREFDGGQSREDAEREAWAEAWRAVQDPGTLGSS